MEHTERPPYLRAIQEVTKNSDLEGRPLQIRYWDGSRFETLTLPVVYPFMTIKDVKTMIYGAMRSNDWLPPYMFLGRPQGEIVGETEADYFLSTDALYYNLENTNATEYLILYSPLKIFRPESKVDKRFVDAFGEKIQTGEDEQDRLTLEELFTEDWPTLYAFCLADMMSRFGLPEDRIPSNKDWNGRFRIYFPALTLDTLQPSPTLIATHQRRLTYINAIMNMISGIDAALQADEPTVNMTVKNIMALRLLLNAESPEDFHLDEFFFATTVNERRPFVRLLPSNDEPITKIHVQGIIPIPTVADPQLLLEWKDELSPAAESDYLFMKLTTRDVKEGGLPLYSTIRVYDDATADVIVLPTKQHGDGLEPLTDLRDFDQVISDGSRETYLESAEQRLGEVSLTLNLALEKGDRRLTREVLLERTRVFSYFFTEIPAYTAVKPIIMLRYRAVSNYRVMNNVFTFFKQNETAALLKGKMTAPELMDKTAVEFNITLEEARDLYRQYLELEDEFTLAVPELGTFKNKNSAGVDIGIFGAHPIYTVQIYRCDSLAQLQRIYTILSLFLTLDIQPPVTQAAATAVATIQPDVEESNSESSGEFYNDDRAIRGKTASAVARTMAFAANNSNSADESDESEEGESAFAGVVPVLEEPEDGSESESEEKAPTVRRKIPKGVMFDASDSEESDSPVITRPTIKRPTPVIESSSEEENESEEEEEPESDSPIVTRPTIKRPTPVIESSSEEEKEEEEEDVSESEEEIVPATKAKVKVPSLMFNNSDSESESPKRPPVALPAPAPLSIARPAIKPVIVSSNSDSESNSPIIKPTATKKPTFSRSMFFDSNSDNSQQGGAKKKAEAVNNSKTADLVLFNYLIKQLRKADPTLFEGTNYVRRCAANAGQQPVVLSEQEYQRMMKEYADDDGMRIITYPLSPGEKEPSLLNETYTVVKYGTKDKIAAQNYYMCPTLFCLKDRIMVRPRDFDEEKWREGYEQPFKKPKGACPFCGGREIKEQEKGTPGYTVYRRQPRPKSKHPDQVFIGFTGKPTDEGYGLPCCFIRKNTLRVSDPEFAHIAKSVRKAELRGVEPSAVEEATAEIEEAQRRAFEQRELTDYEILRFRFDKEYIVAANRYPLDAGVFGLLPPCVDRLFQQNSSSLVVRVAIRQTLAANAAGFFRLGTQGANRGSPDSFFGLVAPYINVNTVDEAREKFRFRMLDPNVFVGVNYGNLVTEFYNPCDPYPTDEEVRSWAANFKPLESIEKNLYEARRIFMAHRNFLAKIDDRREYKEFRVFAPILAVPGLITPNGLILIVIEYDPENPEAPAKVVCPPFGYNPELHRGCDIGFVLRNNKMTKERGYIYEALMYGRNNPASSVSGSTTDTFMTFNTFTDAGGLMTPPIVKALKKEFIANCINTSRAIYSAQSGIRPSDMVTLSQLITLIGKGAINSVVRDIYNHIVGVTFKKVVDRREVLIPFAVADDGVLMLGYRVHLGWNSITAASPDIINAYYSNELAPVLTQRTRYKINKVFFRRDMVAAIGLESGIVLPAGGKVASLSETMRAFLRPLRAMPEYEQNRQLFYTENTQQECDELTNKIVHVPDDLKTITRAQLEELYQHFRISVAHWMGDDEVVSSGLLERIEDVIFRNDLPLFERRRRLWLLIADRVAGWFIAEEGWIPKKPIILRRDCRRITDPGQCDRACAWSTTSDECKIHIPNELRPAVSTKEAFIQRVITELLQFRDRRLEILQSRVPVIGKVSETIRDDDQLILPDSSPTWLELLVSEWSKVESPKYYEEMSGTGEQARVRPKGLSPVPATVAETFDLGAEDWSVWVAQSMNELLVHLGFTAEELCIERGEFTDATFKEMVKLRRRPVIVLHGGQNEIFRIPAGRAVIPPSRALVFVIMDDGRYGLLVNNGDFFTFPLIDTLPGRVKVGFARQVYIDIREPLCAPVPVASPEASLNNMDVDLSEVSVPEAPNTQPIIIKRRKTEKAEQEPITTLRIKRRTRRANNALPVASPDNMDVDLSEVSTAEAPNSNNGVGIPQSMQVIRIKRRKTAKLVKEPNTTQIRIKRRKTAKLVKEPNTPEIRIKRKKSIDETQEPRTEEVRIKRKKSIDETQEPRTEEVRIKRKKSVDETQEPRIEEVRIKRKKTS